MRPTDSGHIVVRADLAVAARDTAPAHVKPWLPADADFHLHGAVFAKSPLGKQPERLEDELARVISELEMHKVQHLLGRSRLSSSLASLMAMEV